MKVVEDLANEDPGCCRANGSAHQAERKAEESHVREVVRGLQETRHVGLHCKVVHRVQEDVD
eukprot:CAMPEP_0202037094 /NCGR_PEP_ID=MMETSP0962-20130828/1962_1 /ASSEMBLY_ACC=CAM_ASM_000488 /TAXON_ID=4773 /ORGANISM="Schizochytrium aggregatum, Strain ATCC28209" /LENGTH=61 /DNA_ID=CAMNT_0048601197 /DNA_START=291 /DNA_END=476 /DNA_ORIENTATION=+